MVKKLIKYDFAAMLKPLLPLEFIVLGTAALNRILQFFENSTSAYRISFGSSVVLLVLSVIVSLVGAVVIAVNRYWRNLFSYEGYLTLSLPVTPGQQLFSKTVSALLIALIASVTAVLGGMIAAAGDVLHELIKAAAYLIHYAKPVLKANRFAFLAEGIVLYLLLLIHLFLVLYACATIGQRARKNRKLLAVGIFFLYYFLKQILGTALIILISYLDVNGRLMRVLNYIDRYPIRFIHLSAAAVAVPLLLFSVLYFLLSRHILRRKLNLE